MDTDRVKTARSDAKAAAQAAQKMREVVRGEGSVAFWQGEAKKLQEALALQELNQAVCNTLSEAGNAMDGVANKMRVVLDILAGNARSRALESWRRRVHDFALRKAGSIDSRLHRIDMTAKVKTGYGAGATPMGAPSARAAAHAHELTEIARRNLIKLNSEKQVHEMQVDVQTAAAHVTRQGVALQRKQCDILREDAKGRIFESQERRFDAKMSMVTKIKLKGLVHQLTEIKDGEESMYAPRVLKIILGIWTAQDTSRCLMIWQSQSHSHSLQAGIDASISVGKPRGSELAGVSLNGNPAIFLAHAAKQADRLKQAKSTEAIHAGQSYAVFASQKDARARKAEVEARVNAAAARAKQGETRRHNIEPAPIYLSIWFTPDKHRAARHIIANFYLAKYYHSLWERKESSAGTYFMHAATNQVAWDQRPAEAQGITDVLRGKVYEKEDAAGYKRSDLDND